MEKSAANLLTIVLAKVASQFRETSEFNLFGRFSQGMCERVHSNETELSGKAVLDCDHRDDDAAPFSRQSAWDFRATQLRREVSRLPPPRRTHWLKQEPGLSVQLITPMRRASL